jgi:hypothetical protein
VTDAKTETALTAPAKKKKKQSVAAMQRELRDLARPAEGTPEKPPVDFKKIAVRVGGILAVIWVVALGLLHWSWIPSAIAGVLTLLGGGAAVWVVRYVNKSRELGALLKSAGETEEGRREAIKKLETDYKKGDVQASIARAQLEMQEDPRKALATLESIDLAKQMAPVADQVRCTRATIHLQLGELQEARALVDKMELGKQQDVKTRAMFAAVAAEAWGRTGDMKAAGRALRKLCEMSPQLLGMFVGAKKVHPMLQQEAKQILMRSGAVPRKMVRQKL